MRLGGKRESQMARPDMLDSVFLLKNDRLKLEVRKSHVGSAVPILTPLNLGH